LGHGTTDDAGIAEGSKIGALARFGALASCREVPVPTAAATPMEAGTVGDVLDMPEDCAVDAVLATPEALALMHCAQVEQCEHEARALVQWGHGTTGAGGGASVAARSTALPGGVPRPRFGSKSCFTDWYLRKRVCSKIQSSAGFTLVRESLRLPHALAADKHQKLSQPQNQ
jgi:hypothetical protein